MTVRETYISKTLSALGDGVAKVDEKIKALLADKQILARILKYSVEEFKYYDIRFNVRKGKERIKVLVNIEAQGTTNVSTLGYHIESRMTYYLSRMISAQKEQEFFGSDYDSIKEVISIWICMDARKSQDSIVEHQLRPEIKFGEIASPEEIKLLTGIIIKIRRRKEVTKSKNKLIEMLEYLITDRSVEEKKNYLKNECGMQMTVELERKIEGMGSIGRVILESALEEARMDMPVE